MQKNISGLGPVLFALCSVIMTFRHSNLFQDISGPPPLVTSTFHNIFRLISNIFRFSDATSTICDVTPANSETIPRFYNPTVDSDSDLLIFFNIFDIFRHFPIFPDISRHSPTVVKSRKMWGNLIFKTFSYRIFCLFSPCG